MRDDFTEPLKCTELEQVAGQGESTYPSVAALAADLGLSERSTRSALRRREIPHIRIGRRFILPRAAIAEWLRTAGQNHENATAAERSHERSGLIALSAHSEVTVVRPTNLAGRLTK